jgi:FHA domain
VPEWTYVPGQLPVIIGDSIMVVLAGERAENTARRIMSTVRIAEDVSTVIDEIVSDAGVRNSPSFFVGEVIERSLHCVIRGALAVNVENSSGEVSQLTATGYQTWAEFRVDSFERFWVSAFSDRPSRERRPARPGPLAVSALVFDLAGAAPSVISSPVSARTMAPESYHEAAAAAAVSAERPVEPDADARPAPVASPVAPVPVAATATSYDALFGDVTVAGSIELAAVRDEAAVPALDAAAITDADFDTSTAAISAILCKSNHANPPERANCWRCSSPLADGKVVRINRPALGQLVFGNGRTVTIDRTILVGRSPRADRTDSGGIPQLVMVDSPHGDVSRTHARIFIEGWRVLLEDTGSTNGTVITTEAGISRRIRSGEPAIVTDGSTIDLGDGAVFRAVDVP